jgi:hypothetical protein
MGEIPGLGAKLGGTGNSLAVSPDAVTALWPSNQSSQGGWYRLGRVSTLPLENLSLSRAWKAALIAFRIV